MHSQPLNPTPPAGSLSAPACGYLVLGAISLTSLAGIIIAVVATDITVELSVVGMLSATAAIGGCGYIVRTAQAAVTRRFDQLDDRVAAQRVMYLPSPRPAGHMYMSRAAQEPAGRAPIDTDTEVPEGVTNLPAPETLRAARSLASKLIASERQRVEDNPEDTRGLGM